MSCHRFGGLLQRALAGANSSNGANSPMQTVEETDELTKEQFRALLEKIDSGLRALPATAQVGRHPSSEQEKTVSALCGCCLGCHQNKHHAQAFNWTHDFPTAMRIRQSWVVQMAEHQPCADEVARWRVPC
jgi:hypothetical protein